MSKLVIRHARSEANDRSNSNDGRPAFGAPLAKLAVPGGQTQAMSLGRCLEEEYGLRVVKTPVATSPFVRAMETAKLAGFIRRREYPLLGEVDHGLSPAAVRAMIDRGKFPPASYEAAVAVLENPPKESVWVTHGLLIAALCHELGVRFDRFIPRCCEIRRLPI